ncbi:MAG: hypothetical protein R3E93_06510 [Thiothrix sp.]
MNTLKTFRIFILIYIAILPLMGLTTYFSFDTLPITLQEYLLVEDTKGSSTWNMILGGCFLALLVIALLGMWLFKFWAKTLYMIIMVVSIPLYPWFGVIIMTPWESLFNDSILLIDGILISMMFSSPVREAFTKKQLP